MSFEQIMDVGQQDIFSSRPLVVQRNVLEVSEGAVQRPISM